MLKRFAPLSIVALSLLLLVSLAGCGQRPEAVASQKLDAALHVFRTANQGFVPVDAGGKPQTITLQMFRIQTLAKAVPDLQEVVSKGNAQQQVQARSLLAQIDALNARYLAQQANDAFGTLAGQSGTVLTNIVLAEQASEQVSQINRQGPMVVNELTKVVQQIAAHQKDLAAQRQALGKQIDQATAKEKQLRDQSTPAFAKAQKLSQSAFLAGGEKQYNLYNQADGARKQAMTFASQADTVKVQLQSLQARAAMLDQEIKLSQHTAADVQQQMVQPRKVLDAKETQLAAAKAELSKRFAAVIESDKQLNATYQQKVASPLDAAAKTITTGLGRLSKTLNDAKGAQHQAIQAAMLGLRLDQLHILSQHAAFAANMASLTQMVAQRANAVMSNGSGDLQAAAQQFKDEHDKLTTAAQQALATAQQLVVQANAAPSQADQVQAYAKLLAK